jgi:hypothetical protein
MIVLQRITLHLARTKQHPEGTSKIGYDIVAPLDRAGRLDADAWRAHRAECRVKRFRASKPEAYGVLLHRPGGVDGATWAIDYNLDRADDDELAIGWGAIVSSSATTSRSVTKTGRCRHFASQTSGRRKSRLEEVLVRVVLAAAIVFAVALPAAAQTGRSA